MKKTAVSLLLEFTHSVEDYRKGNRLYYPSSSIIFITFIGILCGAKQWDEIVEVGESCENLLKEYLREEFFGISPHGKIKESSMMQLCLPFLFTSGMASRGWNRMGRNKKFWYYNT